MLHDNWVDSDHIRLYSDAASSRGFAGIFGSHWFAGGWNIIIIHFR